MFLEPINTIRVRIPEDEVEFNVAPEKLAFVFYVFRDIIGTPRWGLISFIKFARGTLNVGLREAKYFSMYLERNFEEHGVKNYATAIEEYLDGVFPSNLPEEF